MDGAGDCDGSVGGGEGCGALAGGCDSPAGSVWVRSQLPYGHLQPHAVRAIRAGRQL